MKPAPASYSSVPDLRIRWAPLRGRLLNLLVSPGDVFAEVIATRHAPANWLLPILLNCFAAIVLWSAAADCSSSAGWTKAEASSAHSSASLSAAAHPAGARLAGAVAIVVITFAGTFWSALVMWLIGRLCLRTHCSFPKAVEIAGLTTVILVLETVVTLLLVLATDDGSARPALSLLVGKFNPASKAHQALAAMNLFHLWMAAVLSIGLAKLSEVSVGQAAVWVFGYWIVLRVALIGLA